MISGKRIKHLVNSEFRYIGLWAFIVMTLGLSLSIVGFTQLQQITKERLFLETEKNIRSNVAQLQTNINISLDSLTSVSALYQAAGDLSTTQLEQIFNTETHYHSGTLGLAWVPRVTRSQKQSFEQKVREVGIHDFQIYEVSGHGIPRPAAGHYDYYPVRAVFPLLGTDLRPGLNLAAIASRKNVMQKAMLSAKTAITDRVSIFHKGQHLYGFQAFHPVYEDKQTTAGEIVGYVVGLYDFKGLFDDIFAQTSSRLTLYESGSSSQQLLYTTDKRFSTVSEVRESGLFHWSFPLQVADRQWIVSVFPDIEQQQEAPPFIPLMGLIAGLSITSLLTLYLVISLIRSRQITVLATDLAGTENQLDMQRQLKQEADRANQAKSNMLKAASHDLRQPLHTIGLLTGLLKSTTDPEQQKVLAERIELAVDSMDRLFGTLLDLSLLESGQMKYELKPFHINQVLDKLFLDFELQARNKGLDLTVMPCSASVMTDPTLLEGMIRNLLSNAIRYTCQGRILLGCRRKKDFLRICVLDTGIGMDESVRRRVADEFFRDEAARQLSNQGLGLGLAIVSRTAQMLRLGFHVDSVLEKGSCFSIDVPYAEESPTILAETPETPVAALGKTVWIIEDDAAARFALEQVLDAWQCQTLGFSTAEAIEQQLAGASSVPDAIIADYHLGPTIGLSVIQRIHRHFHHEVPALVISASADAEEVVNRELGDGAFLLKPVRPAQLFGWLSQLSAN